MTEKTTLTVEEIRAAILAADDITIVAVPCPEWPAVDGQIYVRTMSAAHRAAYLDVVQQTDMANARDALAIYTVCDAAKTLLFTSADVAALAEKSWQALERVTDAAAALNGFGADATAAPAPRDVDDKEKRHAV